MIGFCPSCVIRKLFSLNDITIGVAPITQVTHMHNKNSNIQERSLNVIKVIFHTLRRKELAPSGANSFL